MNFNFSQVIKGLVEMLHDLDLKALAHEMDRTFVDTNATTSWLAEWLILSTFVN